MHITNSVIDSPFYSRIVSLLNVSAKQVLTQEDWNTVMYDGMRATTKWAALYFILLMTIGNYILFNLLVAILVEGFANQPVRSSICFPQIFKMIFKLLLSLCHFVLTQVIQNSMQLNLK